MKAGLGRRLWLTEPHAEVCRRILVTVVGVPLGLNAVVADLKDHQPKAANRAPVGGTEFGVQIADVELGTGPGADEDSRPQSALEKRLRALHRPVAEYVFGSGLLDFALDIAPSRLD